jgi:hypothetical protein
MRLLRSSAPSAGNRWAPRHRCLAGWLIGQGRGEEAEPLLTEAIATFESLKARPALERAVRLSGAAEPVSSSL